MPAPGVIVNSASPIKMRSLTTLLFAVALLYSGWANDVLPAAKEDRAILLHGGMLHPISDEPIPEGKLLMSGGRILAIGRADEVLDGEENALKVSCSGSHVYPGLISANGTLGLVEISAVRATVDLREPGMINPSVRAESAVNPDSELFPVARANGILSTLTVPQSGGLLSGRSALLQLDGWTWEDMVVKAPVGMHLFWPRMRYGSSASADAQKSQRENWEERLTRANADRFFLAKLFAVGLIFVAGLNLIPVLTQLITWGDLFQINEIPNWFFLQVAICLLNLLYAIFLFQINDWSAMRSVSVLMLVLAFIYGICCTGL